jgi:hypothetical protein
VSTGAFVSVASSGLSFTYRCGGSPQRVENGVSGEVAAGLRFAAHEAGELHLVDDITQMYAVRHAGNTWKFDLPQPGWTELTGFTFCQ